MLTFHKSSSDEMSAQVFVLKTKLLGWRCNSVADHLARKPKVLTLIPNTEKNCFLTNEF